MKFSILTLLFATGYVALVFAALREPDSWWRYASVLAWLAILAYVLILATDAHSKGKAVFGRVFVACLSAYLVLTWLPVPLVPTSNNRPDLLPHHWLAVWLTRAPQQPPATSAYGPQAPYRPGSVVFSGSFAPASYQTPEKPLKTIESVAALNVALLFGLLAGIVALWRFRRNETDTTIK